MSFKGSISTVTNIGGSSGPTIAFGSGVPSNNTINGVTTAAAGRPTTGSQYIRSDGTTGARIYWYYGSSWVAQSSP